MAIIPVINIGGTDYPIADEEARQRIGEIYIGIEGVTSNIQKISSNVEAITPYNDIKWNLKFNIDAVGNYVVNYYMAVTDPINCNGGRIYRNTPAKDASNKTLLFYVSQFNGSTFLSRTALSAVGAYVDLNASATTFRIAIGRASDSGIEISQTDIDTYYDAEIYIRTVPYADYNVNAFAYRGRIQDLGYTSISQCVENGFYGFGGTDSISDLPDGWIGGGLIKVHKTKSATWQEIMGSIQHAVRYGTSGSWFYDFSAQGEYAAHAYSSFGECAQPGYYIFSSSDSISDLPDGWIGGGLLRVYSYGNVTWQELTNNTQQFIRYGTTGRWYSKNKLIFAKYDAESGLDSSDAHLDISIPKRTVSSPSNIVYRMGHCVDNSINANVWRIMYMYLEQNTRRQLTIQGEWECALHLEGRDDFSGGIVHGDEVDETVTAFVDGTPTVISEINGFCNELKIVRNSLMYDPNDHQTVIAEHGVEYKYTLDGLTIRQSVKWRVSEQLTACFLAMLPIVKAYSTQRFSDVDFTVSTNSETDFSVTIPGAKSVTEYNADYDVFTEMSISEYPSGLTGGDCALITDNGGRNYNKVYFPVCTSGTSETGAIWKSTTTFRSK